MAQINVDSNHHGSEGSLNNGALPISVTGRLMLILNCFRSSAGPLNLTDISRRTQLPTSTVHRLLGELCEWNALVRTPDGYRVSLRLFEIGVGAVSQEHIYRSAAPAMQDIFSVTGENVHLSVLDDDDVVFVAKLIGRHSRPTISRPGGRLPAYATASGRIMLAHAGSATVDHALKMKRRKYTRHTITEETALRELLDSAAAKGFVVSVDEIRVGSEAIAAPVFSGTGGIIAALSVVGNSGTLNHNRLVPALRTGAMALSRSIEPP